MQTQIMEMDAILHVHLWSQAGFDQADQLLQVTHVLFVHQTGIKTMRQHQQHESHIEVTEKKTDMESYTIQDQLNLVITTQLFRMTLTQTNGLCSMVRIITNKEPKNLAQVYIQLKSANAVHEIKNAEEYSTSQSESISKSLDEFVTRVVDQDLRGKNPIFRLHLTNNYVVMTIDNNHNAIDFWFNSLNQYTIIFLYKYLKVQLIFF